MRGEMSGRQQVQTMKYFLQYGKFSSNMGEANFVLARAPYNLGPSWLYVCSNTHPIVMSSCHLEAAQWTYFEN